MGNESSVETSQEKESGNGVHEISFGKVLARIYRNVSQREGVYFRVKFFREEANAENDWLAKSFFREDMVCVAKAATSSYIWLQDSSDYVPAPVLSVVAKFSRRDEAAKNSPIHEVQVGNVLASVWENTSRRTGTLYHKVSFRRGEIRGTEVMLWNNFRPEDLSHVAQAATNCRIWFGGIHGEVQRSVVTTEGEKNRPAKRKPRRAAK
jgi:hypothetical protein